ncbi:hypothetical protein [Tenacibaculum crassostreae]|uniref:hypothetical protein n=1 Tax=Tenacibaculum crassostreae TaxID=502683 RepID=UPI003895EAC2
MNITKKHSVIALGYFLIIAILGVLLRCFSIAVIDFNYKHIVHAHSHVALLGWVYSALMVLIYQLYLKKANIEKKYKRIFWFTQFTIVGMLVTFPITGYALFSILFSTLFIIASYLLGYLVFKHTPKASKATNSYKCIKWSLWYMILSSVGPWALGIIMNTLGETSSWYRNAIYFYLHFQYNGWFIVALFGVLFYIFEEIKINISNRKFQQFFWLLNFGVIFTFVISILWMKLPLLANFIAGSGALLQLFAFGILLKEIIKQKEKINITTFSPILSISLKVILFFYSIKLIIQFIGTIPYFANLASTNIDFVIGYLHWIFLGVVSLALLAFLSYFKLIKLTKSSIVLYITGFLLTELFIYYRGLVAWKGFYYPNNYPYLLVTVSVFFMIVIGYILTLQFNRK